MGCGSSSDKSAQPEKVQRGDKVHPEKKVQDQQQNDFKEEQDKKAKDGNPQTGDLTPRNQENTQDQTQQFSMQFNPKTTMKTNLSHHQAVKEEEEKNPSVVEPEAQSGVVGVKGVQDKVLNEQNPEKVQSQKIQSNEVEKLQNYQSQREQLKNNQNDLKIQSNIPVKNESDIAEPGDVIQNKHQGNKSDNLQENKQQPHQEQKSLPKNNSSLLINKSLQEQKVQIALIEENQDPQLNEETSTFKLINSFPLKFKDEAVSQDQKQEFQDQNFIKFVNPSYLCQQYTVKEAYQNIITIEQFLRDKPGYSIYGQSPKSEIYIDDVKQGKFANSYMLSALTALSSTPQRIFKIIKNKKVPQNKCYIVNLYINGVQKVEVLLDQKFPYLDYDVQYTVKHPQNKGQTRILHSNIQDGKIKIDGIEYKIEEIVTPNESYELGQFVGSKFQEGRPVIWPMLIQKALAKSFGSYNEMAGGCQKEIFQILTGMPCQQINLQKFKSQEMLEPIWKLLDQALIKGYPVILSNQKSKTVDKKEYKDRECHILLGNYLLNKQDRQYKVLKLLNVRDQYIWQSEWGQESLLWTPELRKYVKYDDLQEREYFFPFEKIAELFPFLTICYYDEDLKEDALNIEFQGKQSVFVAEFQVTKDIPDKVYFNLSTQMKQFKLEREQNVNSVNLMLCKHEDNGKVVIIQQKINCGSSFFQLQSLSRGKYFLIGESLEYEKYLILKVSSRYQVKLNLIDQNRIENFIQSVFNGIVNSSQRVQEEKQSIIERDLSQYFLKFRAIYFELTNSEDKFEKQCEFENQIKYFKSIEKQKKCRKEGQKKLQFQLSKDKMKMLVPYHGECSFNQRTLKIQSNEELQSKAMNGDPVYDNKGEATIRKYQNHYGTYFCISSKLKVKCTFQLTIKLQSPQDVQNQLVIDSKGAILKLEEVENYPNSRSIKLQFESGELKQQRKFLFIRKKKEKYFDALPRQTYKFKLITSK